MFNWNNPIVFAFFVFLSFQRLYVLIIWINNEKMINAHEMHLFCTNVSLSKLGEMKNSPLKDVK